MAGAHPIWIALGADVAATLVVFGFSVFFDNSSFYDPYWSVAPLPIGIYWAVQAEPAPANAVRLSVVLLLVTVWGARLTFNFFRGWKGLAHEDWRYVEIRKRSGRFYWPVSLLGIHMFPTLIVFAGCLPIYVIATQGERPFGALDLLATAVTGAAIWIEAAADAQLRRFARRSDRKQEEIMASGLWAYSRHPNYFGEMLFWWGLYLFALAAAPDRAWTFAGALAITVMFHVVSLRLMEGRMLERRPQFAQHVRRTSAFVPWFPSEK